MIDASLNTEELEKKINVLSSGLGGILNELIKSVGDEMSNEAKGRAPVRTGRLRDSIKFLFDNKNNIGALTTRKSLIKSNIWYAKFAEFGTDIKPKNKEYLTFKVNGEWKKVKSVKRQPKPFMYPVFDNYFGSDSSKGMQKLQEALIRKIESELN
jgi:HK97 gp10 family phage protein